MEAPSNPIRITAEQAILKNNDTFPISITPIRPL